MMTRPGAAVYVPAPPDDYMQDSAKWDAGITSLTDLAAVSTIRLVPPVIRAWVSTEFGTEEVWVLRVSSASTSVDEGIQRPTDYDSDDPKVWFRASA